MRNLKRALSLGLTAAMISGLMVMGTSAASSSYTDVADTDNVEAIEVLKSVGIMVGDESGDFNPDQNVTRNEMAVVMSNLMAYNVATYANTSPFTDVPSWAEPYVAACWTNGITAGYSDTTYGGSDTVTTAQAALMVMKALGYFQYGSDFGSDWQLATVSQGNRIDLFTDVDSGVREAMTRNDVAQLVLNALEAGTVEAETDGSITVGDITITNNVSYKFVTSGRDYATTINDRLDTNNDGTYSSGAIVELGEKLYQGDLTKEESYDDFGRPANIWEYQAKEIGTFADEADYSFTAKVTSKALYDQVGRTATNSYRWNVSVDGVEVNYDGEDLNANKSDDNDDFLEEAGLSPATGVTGNGVVTEVFVDGTERTVDVAVIHYYAAEVYEVDADEGTITLSNAYSGAPADIDDEYITDEFAEDDIVMYSYANGEIQDVYAAEQMTGEVTRVRVDANNREGDYYVTDGNTHNYNYTLPDDERLITENVNNDVVAYLDAYDYAAYIDESAISYDYAYVLSMGTDGDQYGDDDSSTVYARLVLTDGTMVKVETDADVIDIDGTHTTKPASGFVYGATGGLLGHIVSYTVDKNDVYTLVARDYNNSTATDKGSMRGTDGIKSAPDAEDIQVENGVASFEANGDNYTINSNTVFIVADQGEDMDSYDYYAYVGVKNVPDIKGQTVNGVSAQIDVAANEEGVAKVVYVQDADVAGAGEVIYARADKGAKLVRDSEDGDYREISAVRDGEVVTLRVKVGSAAEDKLTSLYANEANGLKLTSNRYIVALESITENADGLVTNVRIYEPLNDGDGWRAYTTANDEEGTGKSQNETVALGGTRYAWYEDVTVVRYDADAEKFSASTIGSVKDDTNDETIAVFDSRVINGLCIVEYPNDGTTTGGPTGGSDTTLPTGTDLRVNFEDATGYIDGNGRYDDDEGILYLQFTGLTAGASKVDLENVQISDAFGSGNVIDLEDVELIETKDADGTTSYVIEVPFKATQSEYALFNSITVEAESADETVTEWYVKYTGDVNTEASDATVANTKNTQFTVVVDKPAGAVSYDVTSTGNVNVSTIKAVSGGSELASKTLAQTGLTDDVTYTLAVGNQNKQPVVVANVSSDTVALNQTVSATTGNGILAVAPDDNKTTLKYDTASQDVTVTVVLSKASTDTNDEIAVNYKVNGVAQDEVTEASANTTQNYTIDLPIDRADTKGTVNVEITSVELRKPVTTTAVTTDVAISGNLESAAKVKVLDAAGKEVADSTKIAVGTKLTIEVTAGTIKSGSAGVIFMFDGTDSSAVTTSGSKVTFTYTVVDNTNTIHAVTVKNA